MGNSTSLEHRITFEDMQNVLRDTSCTIITTLKSSHDCFILRTIKLDGEENYINHLIDNNKFHTKIVIYGMNLHDTTVETKRLQLQKHGFTKVYIYTGGLFEWMLLQEIYSKEHFPTTKTDLDIYKYRPRSVLN